MQLWKDYRIKWLLYCTNFGSKNFGRNIFMWIYILKKYAKISMERNIWKKKKIEFICKSWDGIVHKFFSSFHWVEDINWQDKPLSIRFFCTSRIEFIGPNWSSICHQNYIICNNCDRWWRGKITTAQTGN